MHVYWLSGKKSSDRRRGKTEMVYAGGRYTDSSGSTYYKAGSTTDVRSHIPVENYHTAVDCANVDEECYLMSFEMPSGHATFSRLCR